MIGPKKMENAYQKFINNLPKHLPDGILSIDSELAAKIGLDIPDEDPNLMIDGRSLYFHIFENKGKVMLSNSQFAIWIVPQEIDNIPTTVALISLVNKKSLHLELGFSTSGKYNVPKYILKALKYFLSEIIDTEEEITAIMNEQSG